MAKGKKNKPGKETSTVDQQPKPTGTGGLNRKAQAKKDKPDKELLETHSRNREDPPITPLTFGSWDEAPQARAQEAVVPMAPINESVSSNTWNGVGIPPVLNLSTSWAYVAGRRSIPSASPTNLSASNTPLAVVNGRGTHRAGTVLTQSPLSNQPSSPSGSVSTLNVSSSRSPGSPSTSHGTETDTSLSFSTENEWDTCKESSTRKTPEELEQQKLRKQVDKCLEGWPWREDADKGIMVAPLFRSNQPFAKPQVKQDCAMSRTFERNPDVQHLVLAAIFKSHAATSKFSILCQETFTLLENKAHVWDQSYGFFQDCDKLLPENKAQGEQESAPSFVDCPPVHVLVVSTRRPGIRGQPDLYQTQLTNLKNMTIAVSNWADVIQNLQLHKVPWITVQLLELIVPQMRNLRSLGIFRCQLIHVGDGEQILDILQTDRPRGKENQVSLDFYPNFHVGPVDEPGNPYCVGGYGITWDNFKGVGGANCLATWCLVNRILSKARSQGVDLESDGSMFMKWLHDGPCFEVDLTVRALGNPKFKQITTEMVKLRADLKLLKSEYAPQEKVYKSGRQRPEQQKEREKTEMEIESLEKKMLQCQLKLAPLVAYIDAANTDHRGNVNKFTAPVGNRPDGWYWTVITYVCRTCHCPLLGIFFPFNHLPRRGGGGNGTCWGCRMSAYLDLERDHLKDKKRDIIKEWLFHSGDWNSTDIGKAIKDFEAYEIANRAADLDALRNNEIRTDNYDREYKERQRIKTKADLVQRYSSRHWAIDIYEKRKVCEGPYDWNYVYTARQRAHGI